MRNRYILLFLILILLPLLAAVQPQYTPPPAKDGPGSLAIRVDARLVAPEYHSPVEWWRTHHMDRINGGDFTEAACLHCHDAQTSCNNCHSYVGVKTIVPLENRHE